MEVTDCHGKIAGEPDARYISHPVDAAADCSLEAALHTRCFALSLSLPQACARLHSLSRVIRGSRETEREGERVPLCPADPIFQGTSLKSSVPYVECARIHRSRIYDRRAFLFLSLPPSPLFLSFFSPRLLGGGKGCNIDKCFALPPFFFTSFFSSSLPPGYAYMDAFSSPF